MRGGEIEGETGREREVGRHKGEGLRRRETWGERQGER